MAEELSARLSENGGMVKGMNRGGAGEKGGEKKCLTYSHIRI
jgi:hypothetical protein